MLASVPQLIELRFPPGQRTPFAFAESELELAAATALERSPHGVAGVDVQKISFDARRRHRVCRVVATVWMTGEERPAPPEWTPPTIPPPADRLEGVFPDLVVQLMP